MKCRIIGADADTAKSVELIVEADSRGELAGIARRHGVLISDIIESPEHNRHSGTEDISTLRYSETIDASVKEGVEDRLVAVPKEGAALGCVAGTTIGFGCLIPLGIALCFTGIGAIIGIPLILAGLLTPFMSYLLGTTAVEGRCPWCGKMINAMKYQPGLDCPACKRRILVTNGKLLKP